MLRWRFTGDVARVVKDAKVKVVAVEDGGAICAEVPNLVGEM